MMQPAGPVVHCAPFALEFELSHIRYRYLLRMDAWEAHHVKVTVASDAEPSTFPAGCLFQGKQISVPSIQQ